MSLDTWLRILGKHFPKDGEVSLEVLTPSDLFGDALEPAPHPIEGMTLDEMVGYILELKDKYFGYDLFFELTHSPQQFGEINWWELKGVPFQE